MGGKWQNLGLGLAGEQESRFLFSIAVELALNQVDVSIGAYWLLRLLCGYTLKRIMATVFDLTDGYCDIGKNAP